MTIKENVSVENGSDFSESELESIMNEIESLEGEFVKDGGGGSSSLVIDKSNVPANDFQEEVDQALEGSEVNQISSLDQEIAQVNKEIAAMSTSSSPIIPTEQVIVVKNRPDTSAIFAEIPTKKNKESVQNQTSTSFENITETKKMETLDSSLEDTIAIIEEAGLKEELIVVQEVKTEKKERPIVKDEVKAEKKEQPVVKEEVKVEKNPSTVFKDMKPKKEPRDTVEAALAETLSNAGKHKNQENNVVYLHRETKMTKKNNQNNGDTTMNFTISGQMTLQLNFTVGDQVIQLSAGGEEGFCITMDDGVKFSIPIEKTNALKQQKAG